MMRSGTASVSESLASCGSFFEFPSSERRGFKAVSAVSVSKLVAQGTFSRNGLGNMAIHTTDHAGGHFLRQHFSLLHGTVAGGACQPGLQVAGMAEEDEIRHPIHAYPFHLPALLLNFHELFYFGAVSLDCGVAGQALVGVRQPSLILFGGIDMAVQASHAEPHVLFVAEGDGLRCNPRRQLFLFVFVDRKLLAQTRRGEAEDQLATNQCSQPNDSQETRGFPLVDHFLKHF
jgi:hypothetical protein